MERFKVHPPRAPKATSLSPFLLNRVSLGVLQLLSLGFLAQPLPAAEIILSHSEAMEQAAPERFAESRFGAPPSRLSRDGKSEFVRHAVDELVQADRGEIPHSGHGLRSGRSLASTEESELPSAPEGGGRGGLSRRIIPEQGVPLAGANLAPRPLASVSRTGVQEVAVIAGELGFFPRTLFVTKDIPVKLFVTGASKRPLCLLLDLDGFQARKQVKAQAVEELDFTPNRSGQFRFYCPINGIEGTLLVKEAAGAADLKKGVE
jgi:hypothetical protein